MDRPKGPGPFRGKLLAALLWVLGGPAEALDPQRLVTQYLEHHWTTAEGLPSDSIEALGQDPDGYLWIFTEEGAVRFDGRTFARLAPATPEDLETVPRSSEQSLLDRDGNRWIGHSGGLSRTSATAQEGQPTLQPYPFRSEVPDPAVTALLEDTEGGLWVGTKGAGLFRLSNGDFLLWGTREGLSSSAARTIFRDHSGALWIGTDGGGLNRLQRGKVETFTTEDGLPRDVVLSISETEPGTLWLGTAGGGLGRLRDGRIETFSTEDGLTSSAITSLLSDRLKSLWIGTAGGGLNRYRDGRFDAFTTKDGLSNDIVRALLQDKDGDLWIGTDAGLNRFRNGQITAFSTYHGLPSDQILALHQDRGGILWVGTDAGLSRKSSSGFISYTRREGLFNDGLRQILDDDRRLWFCSHKGLFYVEKSSLKFRLPENGRISGRAVSSARDLDCSGYSQPASWADPGGTLWFATSSGAVELHPENIQPPPTPKVALERVTVARRNLALGEPARLPTGSRDIEFHYGALALPDSSQVRFRYRLDPFDNQWIDSGTRRSTRYTNLPAGPFRFRVAATAGGAWSQPEAAFSLEVPKPLYRTQAVLSGALLLALVLSRGIYQLRIQHLVRKNQKLAAEVAESTRQVEEQKEELDRANQRLAVANQQLQRANEELFELDQENTDFLALAAHDLREPLVTLQGFAGELHEVLKVLEDAARPLTDLPSAEQRRILTEALEVDAPEALSFIDSSTERMDQLIQGLMTLSRLGRQKLHFEVLDLEDLVREVLRNLSYQIARQEVEVEVHPLPKVVGDRASLKLIFENLLNNAILYLEPGRAGSIEISGEMDAAGCTYRVKDNGRGISEAARPRIFQVFGRGDPSRVPGEGLGLAFVRATLERHGGSIDYTSELGVGTTFFFSIPPLRAEERDD